MNSKEILLESLTEEQKKTIQRNNPFIVERNVLVTQLYNRGVSLSLLGEISGMPNATIHRIVTSDHLEVTGKSRHEWIKKHNLEEGK